MPGTQARELKRAYGFDEVSIVPGQVTIVKGGEIMYHLGGRALRCGV